MVMHSLLHRKPQSYVSLHTTPHTHTHTFHSLTEHSINHTSNRSSHFAVCVVVCSVLKANQSILPLFRISSLWKRPNMVRQCNAIQINMRLDVCCLFVVCNRTLPTHSFISFIYLFIHSFIHSSLHSYHLSHHSFTHHFFCVVFVHRLW